MSERGREKRSDNKRKVENEFTKIARCLLVWWLLADCSVFAREKLFGHARS